MRHEGIVSKRRISRIGQAGRRIGWKWRTLTLLRYDVVRSPRSRIFKPPMTIGNMRRNGIRRLFVACSIRSS